MMKPFLFIAVLCVSISCKHTQKIPQQIHVTQPMMVDGKLFAALYQQRAADYMALSMQAYNIATEKLLSYQPLGDKPLAIITDIDETVLNNSRYAVQQALDGKDYDLKSWQVWTARAEADTIAGAYSFLQLAASKGVEIFYITNRDSIERPGTLKNLQKYNLPFADEKHLITKDASSSKEKRRQKIAEQYQIVLLLGDNLADFSSMFDKKPIDERRQNVLDLKQEFGNRFIIIPNQVYGDWEGAMYQYRHQLTLQQRDSIYRTLLVR